jgi:hypothetical protein
MEQVLNITLVTGILVNLLQWADLLMSQKQKKKIESGIQSFTIILDDVKPLEWLRLLKSRAIKYFLIAIGLLEFTYLFSILYEESLSEVTEPEVSHFFEYTTSAIALILGFVLLLYLLRKSNRWVYQVLVAEESITKFMLRFLLLTLSQSILFVLAIFIFIGIEGIDNYWLEFAVMIGLFFLSPFLIYAFVIGIVAGLVFYMYAFILIIATIVKVAKWLAWKIADHNKGAVAALTLFITILIGLASISLGTLS